MNDLRLFETDRLILSGWREDQLDDLLALHGDPRVARYLDADGRPWSLEKAEARLAVWRDNFAQHRMGKLRLVRKSDGVFIGRAGFGLFGDKGEPEIGYALLPAYHGQGYATEAASGLRDWIFRETDWDYFLGFADVRNSASLAVLARIGMEKTHVGILDNQECQFHILRKTAA
ncbi:GNAT family N-acetyltransferase [Devosia submarina]|uniref:GNAT family N-acetyltransferase n=1 Tax=Devosia submarina TaxID=1173082 RepID=UPI000D3808A0|nr:GNAT family N-acetyltransferase [Devosia submarina]